MLDLVVAGVLVNAARASRGGAAAAPNAAVLGRGDATSAAVLSPH